MHDGEVTFRVNEFCRTQFATEDTLKHLWDQNHSSVETLASLIYPDDHLDFFLFVSRIMLAPQSLQWSDTTVICGPSQIPSFVEFRVLFMPSSHTCHAECHFFMAMTPLNQSKYISNPIKQSSYLDQRCPPIQDTNTPVDQENVNRRSLPQYPLLQVPQELSPYQPKLHQTQHREQNQLLCQLPQQILVQQQQCNGAEDESQISMGTDSVSSGRDEKKMRSSSEQEDPAFIANATNSFARINSSGGQSTANSGDLASMEWQSQLLCPRSEETQQQQRQQQKQLLVSKQGDTRGKSKIVTTTQMLAEDLTVTSLQTIEHTGIEGQSALYECVGFGSTTSDVNSFEMEGVLKSLERSTSSVSWPEDSSEDQRVKKDGKT